MQYCRDTAAQSEMKREVQRSTYSLVFFVLCGLLYWHVNRVNRLKQNVGDPEQAARAVKQRTSSLAEQFSDAAGSAVEQVRTAAQSLASKAGTGPLMLNTASRDRLLSIYGIGPVLADKIIAGRPYAVARDAVERGVIPESIFNELSRSLKSA